MVKLQPVNIDIFDREKAFIDQQLSPLTQRFPQLKIVFEHITTQDAAQFVLDASNNIGGNNYATALTIKP